MPASTRASNLLSIAIIGGMGPASTVRFLELVIKKYGDKRNAVLNYEFPRIIMYTVPHSDHMSSHGDKRIVQDLRRAYFVFQEGRAAFVTAPCNTVHQYLEDDKVFKDIPILNIVAATAISGPRPTVGSEVLFLATRQTQNSGIYSRWFQSVGAVPLFPSKSDQIQLDELILSVNSGHVPRSSRWRLRQLVSRYKTRAVLIACTELSLLLPLGGEVMVIDTLESLAEATYQVSSRQKQISIFTRFIEG